MEKKRKRKLLRFLFKVRYFSFPPSWAGSKDEEDEIKDLGASGIPPELSPSKIMAEVVGTPSSIYSNTMFAPPHPHPQDYIVAGMDRFPWMFCFEYPHLICPCLECVGCDSRGRVFMHSKKEGHHPEDDYDDEDEEDHSGRVIE